MSKKEEKIKELTKADSIIALTALQTDTLVVPGISEALTIGSDTYAKVDDIDIDEAYKEIEDPHGGTVTPTQVPGAFHGEAAITLTYTTDAGEGWLVLSNGMFYQPSVVKISRTNRAGTARVQTITTPSITRRGFSRRGDGLVKLRCRMIWNTPSGFGAS